MIALIDYGAGNIRSVEKALMHIGCEVEVTQDPNILMKADGRRAAGRRFVWRRHARAARERTGSAD